jgi:hypothetical protein
MRGFKFLPLAAITASCFIAVLPAAEAQVSINIGVAPECPYGYYDVAPYSIQPMASAPLGVDVVGWRYRT